MSNDNKAEKPMKYRFWHKAALLLTTAALLLLFICNCGSSEPEQLVVREYSIPLAKWPAELNGFSVLLVSDAHLEPGGAMTRQLKQAAAKLTPDVVLLLGDYTRRSCYPAMGCSEAELEEFFGVFSAPYGVYAVFGNHDLWTPRRKMTEIAAKRNVRFLVNEFALIETPHGKVRIFGTEDKDAAEKDLFDRLPPPDGIPEILAIHNPELFIDAPDRFVLAAAGHYHGGQVRISRKIPLRRFKEDFEPGLNLFEGRYLFHTSGLGQDGFPIRLNCPPEIVLLKFYAPGAVPPVEAHPVTVSEKYRKKGK